MIKKILITYHILLCLFAILAGFFLIQNLWMDSFLATVIGERWKIHLAFDQAKLENASEITFDSARLVSQKSEILAVAKNGRAQMLPVFIWGNTAQVEFEELILQSNFFKKLPSFFSPIGHLTKRSLVIPKARFVAHKRGSKLLIHTNRLNCQAVSLRGGALFDRGHLKKAHWVVYLSQKPNTRLLKDLFARMSPQKDGTRKARFILSNNSLSVIGRSGTLFRADWESAK